MTLRTESTDEKADDWWFDADDHTLAQRVEVDQAVFAILYDRYVDRIYGFCHRPLQTREAAEDATSQTFLKAFAALSLGSTKSGSFKSWLFTIAYHLVVDTYRGQRSMVPLTDALLFAQPGPGPENDSPSPPISVGRHKSIVQDFARHRDTPLSIRRRISN